MTRRVGIGRLNTTKKELTLELSSNERSGGRSGGARAMRRRLFCTVRGRTNRKAMRRSFLAFGLLKERAALPTGASEHGPRYKHRVNVLLLVRRAHRVLAWCSPFSRICFHAQIWSEIPPSLFFH